MKSEYLELLCCPGCRSDLRLSDVALQNDRVERGLLTCIRCSAVFAIRNYVPRFVEHKGYASSFGLQWKAFAKSQLDHAGCAESQIRFDSEIGWSDGELASKRVVEIGCGAGRFVDVVSKREPRLILGVDVTDAVDAAQENLGHRDNVFFIQADVFDLPIRRELFDYAYSIGVLHHTPNPQQGFETIVDLVKEGGKVGLSLYDISLYHRPNRNSLAVSTTELLWALNQWRAEFFRSFTTRLPSSAMLFYCRTVVPVLHAINKIPIIRYLRYLLPSTCYKHLPMIWSMVDTMDTYSTKIVHQYRAKDVFQWFLAAGLNNIIVMNSRAGWVSVVAVKGSAKERAAQRRELMQPKSPGEKGFRLQVHDR